MEQDINLENFSPNGYDIRYNGGFYESNILKIDNNYNKIKNNIIKTFSVVSRDAMDIDVKDNICETCEKEIDAEVVFEKLISKAKSDFLAEFVIREFLNKNLNKDSLKYITILENCFAEKEKLLPSDVFTILGRVVNTINLGLSSTERVLIFKEICKNSRYTYDEKLSTLDIILKEPTIYSKECDRHIRNKIILLKIVKDSGFVMDFSEIIEKERKKREYQKKFKRNINEDTRNVDKLEKARDLVTKAAEDVKTLTQQTEQKERKLRAIANILTNERVSAEDKLYSINNVLSDFKQLGKDSITKTMVDSDKYFKFGAGITISCDNIILTVPSGYIAETDVEKDKTIIYNHSVLKVANENNFVISPLVIKIEKKNSDDVDSLYKFFNKYIEFCNQTNIKYNQTTVSGLPAVFLCEDDKYMIFVYNHKQKMIYNIEIKFNVTVLNKESIVRRIVSGIKIGGRD